MPRHYADKSLTLAEAALAFALAETDEESAAGWKRLQMAATRWAPWNLRARVLELEMELASRHGTTEQSGTIGSTDVTMRHA